jgi:hypothetical protein
MDLSCYEREATNHSNTKLYQNFGAKSSERFAARVIEAFAFLLVAAKALHRKYVAHAFFDIARRFGAGESTGLTAASGQAGKRGDEQECQGPDQNAGNDHVRRSVETG